jgi:hypothetical protein
METIISEIEIQDKYILDDDNENLIQPQIKLGFDLTKRPNYLKDTHIKFHRCGWCYNMVYTNSVYCCKDCCQEKQDWLLLNTMKKKKEVERVRSNERYHAMTIEERREYAKKSNQRRLLKLKNKTK